MSNANVSCNDKTCGIRNFGAKVMDCHVAKAPRNDNVQEMPLVSAFEGCQTTKRSFAFTLAETLIAMAIIGVVAAITIPSVVAINQERAWTQQNDKFLNWEMANAFAVMKSTGKTTGFTTNEEFVNELKKHTKIAKICTDDLSECFGAKVIIGDDDEVDVSSLTMGSSINAPNNTSNLVGVQFINGISALIAYDPTCQGVKDFSTETTMGCMSMIYDLNGSAGPNKIGKDIRMTSGVELSVCAYESEGICFTKYAFGNEITPLSMADCEKEKDKLGIPTCHTDDNDYWGGAVKFCGGVSKVAESQAELIALGKAIQAEVGGKYYGDAMKLKGFTINGGYVIFWSTKLEGSDTIGYYGSNFSGNTVFYHNIGPARRTWANFNVACKK